MINVPTHAHTDGPAANPCSSDAGGHAALAASCHRYYMVQVALQRAEDEHHRLQARLAAVKEEKAQRVAALERAQQEAAARRAAQDPYRHVIPDGLTNEADRAAFVQQYKALETKLVLAQEQHKAQRQVLAARRSELVQEQASVETLQRALKAQIATNERLVKEMAGADAATRRFSGQCATVRQRIEVVEAAIASTQAERRAAESALAAAKDRLRRQKDALQAASDDAASKRTRALAQQRKVLEDEEHARTLQALLRATQDENKRLRAAVAKRMSQRAPSLAEALKASAAEWGPSSMPPPSSMRSVAARYQDLNEDLMAQVELSAKGLRNAFLHSMEHPTLTKVAN